MGEADTILINRAPVLTLWASIVAERLGYDRDTALTMGKAVAGLNAQSKGRMLGIFGPSQAPEEGGPPRKVGLGEEYWVEVCGRGVPMKHTQDGPRAVVKDKPISPEKVEEYIAKKFGDDLTGARAAMEELAAAFEPDDLNDRAYKLYERFRPEIPAGKRGWGAKGDLDLGLVRGLGSDS